MIQGQRTRLRAIEKKDLPLFVIWLNDQEVRENIAIYIPLSFLQEENWLESMTKHSLEEQPLVIEALAEDEWCMIGNSSFMNVDHHNRSAEIGLMIGDKQFWGKGYGGDTLQLLLKHGFNNLNLNRIYLRVFESNRRGIRCYEKAGFKLEGRLRQAQYLNGQYVDVLMMSVLRSEWQALAV